MTSSLLHNYRSYAQEHGQHANGRLFAAWLERVPPGLFNRVDWLEFLSAAGVVDPDEQFHHLERLAEHSGIIQKKDRA